MDKTTGTTDIDVFDEDMLKLLAGSQAELEVAPVHLKKRILQRIDDNILDSEQSFQTVRADDGAWIELTPKLRKKVLFINPETGTESYLLKGDPGAVAPPHFHDHDEHCLVLEGEVIFGTGVHLKKGDYHFAPGGTEHGFASSKLGVLVYIQSGSSSPMA